VKLLFRILRNLWFTGWYAFAIFVVLAAVTLNVARLILPMTDKYSTQIETAISGLLGQPVKIGSLDAEWQGLGPRLVLKDVQLLNATDGEVIAHFDKARLGFDLIAYLRYGQLGLSDISVAGINLFIQRHANGSIRVAGIGTQVSEPRTIENRELERWLFEQVQLEIEDTEIYWTDLEKNNTYHFTHVNLRLQNELNRHQLSGSAMLPLVLGDQFNFALDIRGNPLTPSGWTGQLYVTGQGIKVPELLRGAHVKPVRVDSGEADFELWSDWGSGELLRLTGNIGVHGLAIKNSSSRKHGKGLSVENIGGRLLWQATDDGWKFDLDHFSLSRAGRSWPLTRASFTSHTPHPVERADINASFSFLRIEDLRAMLLLSPHLNKQMTTLLLDTQPAGDLRDFQIGFNNFEPDKPKFHLQSQFENLSFRHWRSVPGIYALSGQLVANESAGTIDLDTRNTTIDFPKLFRQTIAVNKASGRLLWYRHEGGWRFTTHDLLARNSDIDTRLRLQLDLPSNGASPFMDLVVNYKNGNGKQVSRYLPAKIMPPDTVKWMDRSILDGRVDSGSLLFHGRISDFPFDRETGKFEVTAKISNGKLEYAPGWPQIRDINAKLIFNGPKMRVRGYSGKIFNSTVSDTRVEIADMRVKPPLLTIDGMVSGATQEKLRFLQESPELKKRFEQSLSDISMGGQSVLKLGLAIPLKKDLEHEIKVTGYADVKNNSLTMDGSLGQMWSNLNGRVSIDDDAIKAQGLRGRFLDAPATMNILTTKQDQKRVTNFSISGQVEPQLLARRFAPGLEQYLHGNTNWQVDVQIPVRENNFPVTPSVHIESSLNGMGITLPKPLNKQPHENRKLVIDAQLSRRERTIYFHFGNLFSTVLQFAVTDQGLLFKRGELACGQQVELPTFPGFRVAGALEDFSLDDWYSVFTNTFKDKNTLAATNGNGKPLLGLSSILMRFNSLTALGQTYKNIQLNALRLGKEWELNVQSDELAGTIFIPLDFQGSPVVMDLERWRLTHGGSIDEKPIDPRDLPAFQITSKQFSYEGIDLGSLVLKASRQANGLKLDDLELTTPVTEIKTTGDWIVQNQKQQSSFQLALVSQNIGQTMSVMGYADTVSGGKGRIDVDVHWPDAPNRVSAGKIHGAVKLSFKDGRLLDLNPGAGRIFGLLSLQTLPRRLTLDFSDLFAKGFSFDEIKGEFKLDAGDAYTNNLNMSGPATKIAVLGRVGLVDKDYDQLVTVIPDVTASVPMLTVLAGAEPNIAIVTWILKNIFQSQIDKALSFQYTITGNWENPKIEKVVPDVPLAADDADSTF
jgi:uncharacterized protein (TIGR02099 family)